MRHDPGAELEEERQAVDRALDQLDQILTTCTADAEALTLAAQVRPSPEHCPRGALLLRTAYA